MRVCVYLYLHSLQREKTVVVVRVCVFKKSNHLLPPRATTKYTYCCCCCFSCCCCWPHQLRASKCQCSGNVDIVVILAAVAAASAVVVAAAAVASSFGRSFCILEIPLQYNLSCRRVSFYLFVVSCQLRVHLHLALRLLFTSIKLSM